MSFEKLNKKVKDLASKIIKEQFDDEKDYSVKIHFLDYLMNEIVLQLAPKIKGFADRIFADGKKMYNDHHHTSCEVLENNENIGVIFIHDDSMYGPELNFVLIIDDRKNGFFHIRKLHSDDLNKLTGNKLKEYKKRGYLPKVNDFLDDGFIFTYNYFPEMAKMLTSAIRKDIPEDERKKYIEECAQKFSKISDMGYKTFQLWDSVEYSASMLGQIVRIIDNKA